MFRVKSILSSSLIAVLFICFFSSNIFAQDSISLAGKYALQFQISQNFTLSSFLGSVVSGKYHFTKKSAIRVGIGYSGSLNNTDKQSTDHSILYENYTYDRNYTSFDVTVQYLLYLPSVKKISFYCGGGPRVGFTYEKKYYNVTYTSPYSVGGVTESKTSGWSVGLMGIAGVEWFFADQMSLLAEYGITYQYNTSKATDAYSSLNMELKSNGYSFGGSSVLFGLSIYF